MAISTYSELKTAIANWIVRDDLTSRIPEFVALAEARFSRDLRLTSQETSTDLTVTSQSVAFPTDFLEARRLYLSTSPVKQLRMMSIIDFWQNWNGASSGVPEVFATEGQNFVFAPAPDGTYTVKLLYYAKFDALSADGDTNWLLTNAPDVYLYGSLIEAEMFLMNDERMPLWAAAFKNSIDSLMKSDRAARWGGDAMAVRAR